MRFCCQGMSKSLNDLSALKLKVTLIYLWWTLWRETEHLSALYYDKYGLNYAPGWEKEKNKKQETKLEANC